MSSILTNNSAMVALQTMKSISANLANTTSQISTGKRIAEAKDNSAVWSISKVMTGDVQGFSSISDSLALGSSTLAVATKAASTVTDLLTQMKGKIVSAQASNVDKTKIQADITTLRDQIKSVVGAAQFNGLNLVDGTQSTVDILSSLNRAVDGTVTAKSITVTAKDLSVGTYAANDVFAGGTGGTATPSNKGDTFSMSLNNTSGADTIKIKDGATAWAAGDKVSMVIGSMTASYTVTTSDVTSGNNSIPDLVAMGLKNAIDKLGITGLTVDYDSAKPGELSFKNAGTNDLSVTGQFSNAGAGALGALNGIDVSATGGAVSALGTIDGMLNAAIDAAASFGSAQTQVDTQKTFVGDLIDSMKAGIGSLVDANMEEASARLQALQVQQQLSTQALSIANQQPQTLLSLFR